MGVSAKRFQGWEPKREIRYEYELDGWGRRGKLLRVVETLEPEFDDDERIDWYLLDEYENAICPKCGNLRVICSDPTRPWFPQLHVCYASADAEANRRRWQAKHERAEPVDWRLPTDGATVWVSPDDLTPDDKFLD